MGLHAQNGGGGRKHGTVRFCGGNSRPQQPPRVSPCRRRKHARKRDPVRRRARWQVHAVRRQPVRAEADAGVETWHNARESEGRLRAASGTVRENKGCATHARWVKTPYSTAAALRRPTAAVRTSELGSGVEHRGQRVLTHEPQPGRPCTRICNAPSEGWCNIRASSRSLRLLLWRGAKNSGSSASRREGIE